MLEGADKMKEYGEAFLFFERGADKLVKLLDIAHDVIASRKGVVEKCIGNLFDKVSDLINFGYNEYNLLELCGKVLGALSFSKEVLNSIRRLRNYIDSSGKVPLSIVSEVDALIESLRKTLETLVEDFDVYFDNVSRIALEEGDLEMEELLREGGRCLDTLRRLVNELVVLDGVISRIQHELVERCDAECKRKEIKFTTTFYNLIIPNIEE